MAKKAFKSESKRLLELMINSIYTHKEIFLRELISNASDAIDKLYYRTLSDESMSFNRDDFYIRLEADKEKRTLTITDTGIGMTKEELEENLGTIAKSGSLQFKSENEKLEDVDIIGQFGVGFYSAFMIADKVRVTSRTVDSDAAWCWEAEGTDGYTVTEAEKEAVGTEIVLYVKPNTEDENYDEFLDEYRLRAIVKKYSDYIRYPIVMEVTKSRPKAAVKDLAKGLIALYAERQKRPGFAFSPDSPWQMEFEEAFPYPETDDQIRAILDIKKDMEQLVKNH